jgi:AraC-like DNA-binding protein
MDTKIDIRRRFNVELQGAYFFRAPKTPNRSVRRKTPATLIVMQAGIYRADAGEGPDAVRIEARAGDAVFWPAGADRLETNDGVHPARCIVCQFDWAEDSPALPPLVHDHERFLTHLANRLVSLHDDPAGLPPAVANAYLAAMLGEYMRLALVNLPELAALVSRFTEEHMAEPFRLADLARGVGLNPCHLVRRYRAIIGRTPMDYVRRRRVERAIGMLLSNSALDPQSVATRVGLEDVRQLRRLIRRYAGMTLREIRARPGGGPIAMFALATLPAAGQAGKAARGRASGPPSFPEA